VLCCRASPQTQPIRHCLGLILLQQGKLDEAEQVGRTLTCTGAFMWHYSGVLAAQFRALEASGFGVTLPLKAQGI